MGDKPVSHDTALNDTKIQGHDIKLSDQQYKIIKVLWSLGQGSAKQVQASLSGQPLAHTTIGTMLSRLEKRGILVSETLGRERVYTPLFSESEVNSSMVSSLVSTLFKGDPSALLAHLVQESEFENGDLDSIRQLLGDEGDDQ